MSEPEEKSGAKSLIIVFLFLSAGLWFSDWFALTGTGSYTEGLDREPTIVVEYTIDASQESVSISLENATPLLQYWRNRETITDPIDEGEDPDGEDSAELEASESQQKASTSSSKLDFTRTLIGILIVLFCLCAFEGVKNLNRNWMKASLAVWLLLGAMLVFQLPIAAVSDFGMDEGGESSTGGFDTANNDEVSVSQFAHFESEGGLAVELLALRFDYNSQGFDLGLLDEEDRQAVIDDAPAPDEPGYESFIRFEGEMKAGPGPVMLWWLVLGALVLYCMREMRTDSSEGSEPARLGA